jgi:hypothetical protein
MTRKATVAVKTNRVHLDLIDTTSSLEWEIPRRGKGTSVAMSGEGAGIDFLGIFLVASIEDRRSYEDMCDATRKRHRLGKVSVSLWMHAMGLTLRRNQ